MKQYIFTILFFTISCLALSQTRETDSVEAKKTTVTLATIYNSNANYYGQTTLEPLPYVLGNVSVKFLNGFFLSASAYKLVNVGSGISGADLTAGFDFNLSKNLTSSLSYSRSFYPDNSLLLQATNLNTISGSLAYDFKYFTSSFNVDYIPGQDGALFTTLNFSKSIDLGSLSSKDYFSIDPSFSIVGGTQRITTSEEVPPPSKGGGLFGQLPLNKDKRKPEYKTVESTSFDLFSYNLKLPVSYNRTSYSIEAAYQGTILSNRFEGASNKPLSFFTLGFYYMF
jgi:hypothetical protein